MTYPGLWELEVSLNDLVEELIGAVLHEGQCAIDEHPQAHARRPDVTAVAREGAARPVT